MEIMRTPVPEPSPAPVTSGGMRMGLNKPLDPTRRALGIAEIQTKLLSKVVGQDEAGTAMLEMYEEYKAGLHAPGKPIGSLLFLGPTGVGKTRTVEALAEAVLGDRRAMVKIDCAEFQHSHEIAKLIGSPPGYLGHRETHALLTQEALNAWHSETNKFSIVLFDEVEKASDALWQLLLGIMDKATLTLGDNRRVSFESTIIIMTSNLGAAEMARLVDGTGIGLTTGNKLDEDKNQDKIERIAMDAIRRKFTPEFIGRIDKTVVFKRLTQEHLKSILEIELGDLQKRVLQSIGNNQFVFSCTQQVKDVLLTEGFDKTYGARHLKKVLERRLARPMARLVASGQLKLGDFVRVDLDTNGEFTFIKEAENALVPVLLEKYGVGMAATAVKPTTPKVRRLSASRLDELT